MSIRVALLLCTHYSSFKLQCIKIQFIRKAYDSRISITVSLNVSKLFNFIKAALCLFRLRYILIKTVIYMLANGVGRKRVIK